jgi:hypothetical protein
MENQIDNALIIFTCIVGFAILAYLLEKLITFLRWAYWTWTEDRAAAQFIRRVLKK